MLGPSRYGMEEMKWEGGRKQQLKQLCAYTHTNTHLCFSIIFYHTNITHTKSVSSKYPVNSFFVTVLPFWEHQTTEHAISICQW